MSSSPCVSSPQENSSDDDFVVQSITLPSDTMVTNAPAVAEAPNNLPGLAAYSDSNSDSNSDSDSDSDSESDSAPATDFIAEPEPQPALRPPSILATKPSPTVQPPAPNGRASPPPLKRVRFSSAPPLETSPPETSPPPPLSPADEADNDDLEADLARLEAQLPPAPALVEESDAALVEAEDLREEALQAELRAKVQRLRSRLQGARNDDAARDKRDSGVIGRRRASEEDAGSQKDEEEAEDSGDELDLLRDWAEVGP